MTITPFGRVEVQVHDLPTAQLQARQPTSRRSARDRFPDPEPKQSQDLSPKSEAKARAYEPPLEGTEQRGAKSAPEHGHPRMQSPDEISEDEGSDGSEGALALMPQDEIVIEGKIRPRTTNLRREVAREARPEHAPTAPIGLAEGQGAAVDPGTSSQQSATATATATDKAGATRALNATQAILQRQQPHKQQTEAATPMRRQSPIQLAQADRQSVLESVSFALSEGKGEAVLHLNPRELGSLSIHLSMQGNNLSLRLSAERREVADALLEDLPKLRAMLQEQGLNVQEFDVRTGNASDHRQQALDFRRSRGIDNAGRAQNGTADADTGSESRSPKSVRIDGTGIDFIA